MSLRIKRRLSVVAMASFVLTSASGVVMSAEESDADSALIFSDRGSDSGYYADQYDPGDGQDDPVEENGAVETFTERYPNGNVKIERQVTLDADGNYVNHGAWKMYNAAGKVVADRIAGPVLDLPHRRTAGRRIDHLRFRPVEVQPGFHSQRETPRSCRRLDD